MGAPLGLEAEVVFQRHRCVYFETAKEGKTIKLVSLTAAASRQLRAQSQRHLSVKMTTDKDTE